jgi:hypothetical protein
MAVDLTIGLKILIAESTVLDLATGVVTHIAEFPGSLNPTGNYTTGTADNKQNRVFSDTRTLTATSETLDLYGGLTDALGVVINFVEIRGFYIRNRATAVASVLIVGNGAAPALAGLFNAAADRIKVGASGCLLWFAPLDGGGLTVTNTTAQDFKIDSGAATITYDLVVWGVDA